MDRAPGIRPHHPLSLLLAFSLLFAASGVNALGFTVGFDNTQMIPPQNVTTFGPLAELEVAEGETHSVEIYLNLEGEEVASFFQADFVVDNNGFDVLDFDPVSDSTGDICPSEVSPGCSPFGVGTWPNVAGLAEPSLAAVSLTSGNAGGERLVAKWLISCPAGNCPVDSFFDVYLTQDPSRLLAGWDIPGGVGNHDMGPFLGLHLAHVYVPEPGTVLLLGAGLVGLAAFGRRSST